MSNETRYCVSRINNVLNQNDVLALDIKLQVKREFGGASGDGSGAVGFGANKIDGDREVDFPDQVGQEDEGASGHANQDWWWCGRDLEIGGDFGGQLRYSLGYLLLIP